MNNKPKDKEKIMDRKDELKQYIDILKVIYSEADNLIKNNGYNNIQLYSIRLCYFNCFDPQKKESQIKDSQKKEP